MFYSSCKDSIDKPCIVLQIYCAQCGASNFGKKYKFWMQHLLGPSIEPVSQVIEQVYQVFVQVCQMFEQGIQVFEQVNQVFEQVALSV